MTTGYLQEIEHHLYITNKLLKALIAYLECKNYGIHGLFIKQANLLLTSLFEEREYLERTKIYLNGEKPPKSKFNKEPYIFLNIKTVPNEIQEILKKDVFYFLGLYGEIVQSQYATDLQKFLERLENV